MITMSTLAVPVSWRHSICVGAKITRFIRRLPRRRKVCLEGNEKESVGLSPSFFFTFEASDRKRGGWSASPIDRSSSKVPPGTRAENSVRWMLTTTAPTPSTTRTRMPVGWMYIALQEVTLYLRWMTSTHALRTATTVREP